MNTVWMRLFVCGLLGSAMLLPSSADAGRRRHVTVVVSPPPPGPPAARRVPSPGPGWVWVASHPAPGGAWTPGHWVHKGNPPRAGWVYVTGYWSNGRWLAGFWRPPARDGYEWVEGYMAADGVYVAGYWRPVMAGPPGAVWRAGYWNGATWVSGSWVSNEPYTLFDEQGELAFIGYGDGRVEELAIADPGEYLDAPPDLTATPDVETETTAPAEEPAPENSKEHHHAPPE